MNKFTVVYVITYFLLFAAIIAAVAWVMHHQSSSLQKVHL